MDSGQTISYTEWSNYASSDVYKRNGEKKETIAKGKKPATRTNVPIQKGEIVIKK